MAGTTNNEETNEEVLKPGETPVIGAGAIARTTTLIAAFALMALSGVNQWLAAHGRSPLNVDQATITNVITYLVSLAAALWAWWKPNNFTKEARRKYALAETIQEDMLLEAARKAYAASGKHVETGKETTSGSQEHTADIGAPASSVVETPAPQDEGQAQS